MDHSEGPGALQSLQAVPEGVPAKATAADVQTYLTSLDEVVKRLDAASALSAAVVACPDDQREEWLEAELTQLLAGPPVPPFTGVMAEAVLWAAWASPGERRAYVIACLAHFSPADVQDLLDFAQRRAAA